MVTATSATVLHDELLKEWQSLAATLEILDQNVLHAEENVARAKKVLKDTGEAAEVPRKPYNDRVHVYNRLRAWQFLDCQYENGLTWCSFAKEFLPNEEGGPFFLLQSHSGFDDRDDPYEHKNYTLLQTPNRATRDGQCNKDNWQISHGYRMDWALPVMVEREGIELVIREDERCVSFWEGTRISGVYSPLVLESYVIHPRWPVPDDLAEKYGVPPALKPI